MTTSKTTSQDTTPSAELDKAREALGNWSTMQADEFKQSARRALTATERRIDELRDKIANSDTADGARETLTKLKQQRDQLAERLDEIKHETGDKLAAARKSIVDGVHEVQDRLAKAWTALTGG